MSIRYLFITLLLFGCASNSKCQQINSADINYACTVYVMSEYKDSAIQASSNLIPYPGERGNIKTPLLIFKNDLKKDVSTIEIIKKDFKATVRFQQDSLLLAKQTLRNTKIIADTATLSNKNVIGTIIIKGVYLSLSKKAKSAKNIFLHVLKFSGVNTSTQREEIIQLAKDGNEWVVKKTIATVQT